MVRKFAYVGPHKLNGQHNLITAICTHIFEVAVKVYVFKPHRICFRITTSVATIIIKISHHCDINFVLLVVLMVFLNCSVLLCSTTFKHCH
jgi:hypothetical protein